MEIFRINVRWFTGAQQELHIAATRPFALRDLAAAIKASDGVDRTWAKVAREIERCDWYGTFVVKYATDSHVLVHGTYVEIEIQQLYLVQVTRAPGATFSGVDTDAAGPILKRSSHAGRQVPEVDVA